MTKTTYMPVIPDIKFYRYILNKLITIDIYYNESLKNKKNKTAIIQVIEEIDNLTEKLHDYLKYKLYLLEQKQIKVIQNIIQALEIKQNKIKSFYIEEFIYP